MSFFFTQLRRSVGVFFRTIRSFIRRRLLGLSTMFRRVTNFSRHATKLATDSLQGVVSAAQKPTGPSDYVETGHLLISKALIIKVLLIVVALGLIIFFLVWPFVLSHFLTAKFYKEDKRVEDWSGRVIVYSDEKKTVPLYSGRLEDGVLQGECKQYDDEGILIYEGQIRDGVHTGNGKVYRDGVLAYDGQLTAGIYNGYGTEYTDGQLLYNGQYADGMYSGTGSLYDKEGDVLYEGQFLDGLYEGRGKLYDNGDILYDGNFRSGLYEGTGKLYDNGSLIYEGQFLNNLYEGAGKLYKNGSLLYEGQFLNNVFEGSGKLYDNGVLRYDGSFHSGEKDGTGTAYYPNGKVSYQGQYLAGKEDGIGTSYTVSGREEYTGGFSEGLYSGEGLLYFEDGSQLGARFQEGIPSGSVSWMKNGILYYQGEWKDGHPSGFGTIFSQAGKKLYEGPFFGGTIDGLSLLKLSTDQLRDALCESSVKTESEGTAFRIYAEELGLTALCSFQSETEDSRVLQIYLTAPEKNNWVFLLPGTGNIQSVPWPENAEPVSATIKYTKSHGMKLASDFYYADNYVTLTRRITALYLNEIRDQAVLLTWENREVCLSAQAETPDSASDSKTEKLLEAIDQMISAEGTAESAGASFGGKPSDDAFAEITDVSQAVSLADAMIDFWGESQRLSALEEVSGRIEKLLEDAQRDAAKGVGAADKVDALEKQLIELNTQMENCKTSVKRAELQASSMGVEDVGSFALEEMLVSFNPAEQDVSGLAIFAATYAKALGGDTDAKSIEKEVKEQLLDLSDAQGKAKLALTNLQSLSENTEKAVNAYSMGLGTKESWYEAMNAESLARIELCTALSEFSKQANSFNQLTGGWVSRTFDWHKDVFEPLFQAAYNKEEEAESGEEDAGKNSEEEQPDNDSSGPKGFRWVEVE